MIDIIGRCIFIFINYAHRGASSYAPENTMSAFSLGLELGANGIETDVRRTRDGILVLYHDKNMSRTSGIDGCIGDFSYSELSSIRVSSADGSMTDSIPRFTDFLDFVKDKDVHLAIEIKDDGIEEDVLRETREFGVCGKCIFTSFSYGHVKKIKELDPARKIGLLTTSLDDAVLESMLRIGGEQICPKAETLTPDTVRMLHDMGFSVRAWGVKNEEIMKHAFLCGVDGMTVNFPDKLCAYLRDAK